MKKLTRQELKEAKSHIRHFMQQHYTDEKLAALLAHAQEEKLVYICCCCFVGIVTADHPFVTTEKQIGSHLDMARTLTGARAAEGAYCDLGNGQPTSNLRNSLRRRILIPLIRAEMRRRERMRKETQTQHESTAELSLV